ncbi:unnamed protein product [Periconia digitata]|uniref:Zn(2)-C6 fungal-type domain-containing protein n=1 Tax=Periconia digitata TaxID=1303443 RepID=A0A9W4UQ35_9PLEO|nr:unnamed protein product [Periconia digitata]
MEQTEVNPSVSSQTRSGERLKRGRHTKSNGPKKRQKTAYAGPAGIFSCFSADGNNVNLHRRSTFSRERKEEVKSIRRRGACLRCRILKRACSGDDPCKTCIVARDATANSKSLMWMECIRPSFQAINIFNNESRVLDQNRFQTILTDLSNSDVYLDLHIPFALNADGASSHLSQWLSGEGSTTTFSLVGVFSCSSNTKLLQNALDPSLARDLRLFVHLTTHLHTTGMQGGYHEYTEEDIQIVRDCIGNRLLTALDPLLRPLEIEASEDRLGRLRSLFLLLLGTVVGVRYTCPEASEANFAPGTELEAKQDALLRLLCHYLIHIGRATAMIDYTGDDKILLQKSRMQWDKPAAFTWSSRHELEMHYRIEPPADWIVSSSENESLSSIDIDLSELEDLTEFTQDSDLLKCGVCNSFWTLLNENGTCHDCHAINRHTNDPGLFPSNLMISTYDDSAQDFSFDSYSSLEDLEGLEMPGIFPLSYETNFDDALPSS